MRAAGVCANEGFGLLVGLAAARPTAAGRGCGDVTSAQVVGRALRVHDAAAGRHPVDRAGLDALHDAEAVAVQHRALEQVGDRGQPDVRMRAHVVVVGRRAPSTGPKWSKKTNGPTARRDAAGSSRRTMKPPPRSWARGASSSIPGMAVSPRGVYAASVVSRGAAT